jgi:hypothetical protein
MDLKLTPEEQELVSEVLEEHHRTLLREISRTDHHEFRVVLKKKEKLLESVLNKLGTSELLPK